MIPGGLVALFGYATPVIGNGLGGDRKKRAIDPENVVNRRLTEFYEKLDWPADRAHVETRYEKLLLDSGHLSSLGVAGLTGWREDAITTLSYEWPLNNFARYLDTWSGYRRLLAKDKSNASLLRDFEMDVARQLGGTEGNVSDAAMLRVDFDVFAVFYRKYI